MDFLFQVTASPLQAPVFRPATGNDLEDDVVFGASGDLVVDVKSDDPACPLKGLPSVHFDFSLARESEADKKAGRVGADPAQVTRSSNGAPTGPYGAPPPEVLAAEQETKKGGFLGGLFRK